MELWPSKGHQIMAARYRLMLFGADEAQNKFSQFVTSSECDLGSATTFVRGTGDTPYAL